MTPYDLRSALDVWTGATRAEDARATSLGLLRAAQQAIASRSPTVSTDWHRYLDETRLPRFLGALPDHEHRLAWATTAVEAILRSQYTLETLLDQRVSRHPRRVLFQSPDDAAGTGWTYAQVRRHARRLAAFMLAGAEQPPRVALFAANGLQAACCDLACLAYDLLDTPIPLHSDLADLVMMFDELGYDLAYTDTDARYRTLRQVRRQTRKPFRILRLDAAASNLDDGDEVLARAYAALGEDQVQGVLDRRRRMHMNDAATVMYTPGTDGRPKGVVFSQLNLVSKRFARAAALPDVGENEVLFCYLPLFHTFGRFLEMLGMLFWGGTYVFARNPSADTLFAGMRTVRPTGLVSIPIRWVQLQKAVSVREKKQGTGPEHDTFAEITGGRLRWGLSAAGYLSPDVFHFFRANGVALCSGFGLTEATGGITMTPPGDYRDGSVGVPLPAIDLRLTDASELQIRGPYVARHTLAPHAPGEQPWIATGDLFRVRDDGHYEIFDRIKDIYKNTRGQTVAPRRVEQAFDGIPGVRRVFLAGDLRDDNTLLVFPLPSPESPEALRARLHDVIRGANQRLAVHERVVDFALAARDLSEALGELSEDGSYRRSVIATSFKTQIDAMYGNRRVELIVGGVEVRIPRWLYRDLGALLSDIVAEPGSLLDRGSQRRLVVGACEAAGWIRVGDLEYEVEGSCVDLGTFARQPLLWAGNPSLAAFCRSKDGWDVPLGSVSKTVRAPSPRQPSTSRTGELACSDSMLEEVHELAASALLDAEAPARAAVRRLSARLASADARVADLIRLRLEALSRHPAFGLRADAYCALLAAGPNADGRDLSLTFLRSGLPFLDEAAVLALSDARLERSPLETLRRSLRSYRLSAEALCPASIDGMKTLLVTLADVGRHHRFAWEAVRAELAAWTLVSPDAGLARVATRLLASLHRPFARPRRGKHRGWLGSVVSDTDLLARSIRVASGPGAPVSGSTLTTLSVMRTGRDGTAHWSGTDDRGRHVDLLIAPHAGTTDEALDLSLRRHAAVHGFPFGSPATISAGLWRAQPRAVCQAHVDAPSAWERIVAAAEERTEGTAQEAPETWRAWLVGSMAVIFRAWTASERTALPASVHPADVLLPCDDLHDGWLISGRGGWRSYDGARALAEELAASFVQRTLRHFPWCAKQTPLRWVLDAAVEALGTQDASVWLDELRRQAQTPTGPGSAIDWAALVEDFTARGALERHVPLAVRSAIRSYRGWRASARDAEPAAREQSAIGLIRSLGLDRFPPSQRYRLYRDSYFADAMPPVREALDRLIHALERCPARGAPELVELSDLQAVLPHAEDRLVFRHLVFPTAAPIVRPDSLLRVDNALPGNRTLRVHDGDGDPHVLRTPASAAEVNAAVRILAATNPVRSVWSDETLLVIEDHRGHIVGCLLYARGAGGDIGFDVPSLHPSLAGGALRRDVVTAFCRHASADGARALRARIVHAEHVEPMGFAPDSRWGELVRR